MRLICGLGRLKIAECQLEFWFRWCKQAWLDRVRDSRSTNQRRQGCRLDVIVVVRLVCGVG